MEQRNCKNCGASIEHSYNHKCSYCGTLFDFNEPEENTIAITPEDLVDVKLRDIRRDFLSNSLILVFTGYKLSMPKIYEYNGKDTYISRAEEYINPPKASFLLEIPLLEIEKSGISYLMWRIEACGLRHREIENIKMQLYEQKELERYF